MKKCKEVGSTNDFVWLLYWFWSQTNDDWEHCYGVSFKVNTDCKWELDIDLAETALANLDSLKLVREVHGQVLDLALSKDKFTGTVDLLSLFGAIEAFRINSEPYCEITHVVDKLELNDAPFVNLVRWYEKEICTYDILNRIEITTLDNPGWFLKVNLKGTKFEKAFFPQKKELRSENNWIVCNYENAEFSCFCGPLNILEAMQFFVKCVDVKYSINNCNW